MAKAPQISIDFTNLPKITNDVYVPLYMQASRYLVLYGGAGSGKSVFVGQKIVMRILTEHKHKFLVVRKIEATIRESARAEIIGAIEQMGFQALFQYSTAPTGEMTITCINGSKIIFRGLDNKEKLKSIKDITGLWLEEASDFTLDDFTQLDLRLRGQLKNYKQIILSFNPITSKHWLKKRFFDNKEKDATVLHTTYLNNRYLDDKYIEVLENLKHTNFSYYQVYALGKWGVLKGLIYEKYTIIDEMPQDSEIHRYGMDFGFNHPTACTEIKIDGNNLYLDEILYESLLTNTELIRRLKSTAPHLLELKGYLDSAEPARIADFTKAGFDVLGALKDVTAGIDKIKAMNIFVTKRSVNIINELDLYSWKLDRNGEPLDEPIKEDDDACFSGDTKVIVNNILMNFKDIPKEGTITKWNGKVVKYIKGGFVRYDKLCIIKLEDGTIIKATAEHKFLTRNGWVMAKYLKGEILCNTQEHNALMAKNTITTKMDTITEQETKMNEQQKAQAEKHYTELFGNFITEKYKKAMRYTTKTKTKKITIFQTLKKLEQQHTIHSTAKNGTQIIKSRAIGTLQLLLKNQKSGTKAKMEVNGTNCIMKILSTSYTQEKLRNVIVVSKSLMEQKGMETYFVQISANQKREEIAELITKQRGAKNATLNLKQTNMQKQDFAVVSVEQEEKESKTYCVTTKDGCFALANNFIVSNCDSFRYGVFIDNKEPNIVQIIKKPSMLR